MRGRIVEMGLHDYTIYSTGVHDMSMTTQAVYAPLR